MRNLFLILFLCATSLYGEQYDGKTVCNSGSISAHPIDCSKFFTCSDDNVVLFQCPGNSLFNPLKTACDFKQNVICNENRDYSEIRVSSGVKVYDGEPPMVTNSTICLKTIVGDLLQNPDNCRQFYHCSEYGAVLFNCPAHLLFNQVLRVCDWPQNTDCYGEGTPTTPTTPEITTDPNTSPTTRDPNEPNLPSCIWDTRCPLCVLELYPTFLPHPSRCNAYLKCEGGYACERECPPGLHWSAVLHRCELPHIANCTEIQRPPCKNPECITDPRCPPQDLPPFNIVFPNPDECDTFFVCHNGEACKIECPSGLHWSASTGRCELPEVAGCEPETTTRDPCNPGTTCPSTCRPDYRCPIGECPNCPTHLPHERCDMFYKCNAGLACEQNCPAGLHWSVAFDRCEYPGIAQCERPGTTTANPGEPGSPANCFPDNRCPINENPFNPTHLPHQNNCSMFYKCNVGNACPMECPKGQHFSIQLDRCEYPWVAKCDPTASTPNPCTPTTCPPILTTQDPIGPTIASNCILDYRCPNTDNPLFLIYFPHQICQKFYRCESGRSCEKSCPQGLHWSTAYNRCDCPHIAKCDIFARNE